MGYQEQYIDKRRKDWYGAVLTDIQFWIPVTVLVLGLLILWLAQ